MSQETLADKLGTSFQQLQKYENGTNRISAGRLHAIASALGATPGHFYEGLPDAPEEVETDLDVQKLLTIPGATDLLMTFSRCTGNAQRSLVNVAEAAATTA
ncbi:helix-turn-helix domain-containing protein [Roseibium sp. TrichSKD4]|uniref:helix-turn-helix domain-containing protein n=1 Tax=Roseibium sp. TrichSKD4 TaxID=744980 RepID=UPI0003026A7F